MKHIGRYISIMVGILFASLIIYNSQTLKNTGNSPKALNGGQLTLHISEFPKSFNVFVNNAADARQVFVLVYASLLDLDENTLTYHPLIAKSWTISPDKKEYTFKLNPDAKWSDGRPITAEDVKFTYDTIMNPKNLTSVLRMYYGRFNPPQIIDRMTVKFTARTVHFKNFEAIAGLTVLPKHLMAGKDFNKAFNLSLPAGSGPYNLTEVKEGRYYVLTRNKNYWADKLPHRRGTYNFGRIKFKVMSSDVAFEAFKRGDFDVYDQISAKRWVEDTKTEQFTKNWIVKQKIYNYAPRGFQGLALNMRKPFFKDVNIRMAIARLLDRKRIVTKMMYNQYQLLNSYWPSLYEKGETSNPIIAYNPNEAKKLLIKGGYDRLDSEGYLVNRHGHRAEFTIFYTSQDSERYLTIFTEDCKKVGVKVNLKLMSWATLIKKMENYDFDAVTIAWSGELFTDPEQLWHSRHLNEAGGSNLPGYRNAEVDRLIDSLPGIYDVNKRIPIIKQIDRMIAKDVPYILFWEANYTRLFYKNIFGMPKTVFYKYSSDSVPTSNIIQYWWFDPTKAKKYQEAVKKRIALPPQPVEVHFDEIAK